MKPRIVVKLGGSALQIPATLRELATLVHGLRRKFEVSVVHGGGPAINQELTRRGIEWKFINGQRQTSMEMMAVIEDVLARQTNSMVTDALRAEGFSAVGISGAQNGILSCTQASAELIRVGKIESVNPSAIEEVLQLGQVPVIAPIGAGLSGEKYNVNADWAAAKIAIALNADKLIFLTDQNGVLDQNSQLIPQVTPLELQKMIGDGIVTGGMYTKVMTMIAALDQGVRQVQVLNAGAASYYLTDDKIGTLLADDFAEDKKEVTEWTFQTM